MVDGNSNGTAATAAFEIKPMTRVMIFGGITGWIGQMMGELVEKTGMCINNFIPFHCMSSYAVCV
jgi:hypothetical protein